MKHPPRPVIALVVVGAVAVAVAAWALWPKPAPAVLSG